MLGENLEMLAAVGLLNRLMSVAPADDDRLPSQLRITEQFNGCKKGIHIKVGNSPIAVHPYSITKFRRPGINGKLPIDAKQCRTRQFAPLLFDEFRLLRATAFWQDA